MKTPDGDEYVNIGHGVSIAIRKMDGVPAGLMWRHPHGGNGATTCSGGWIAFKGGPSDAGPKTSWDVIAHEPLTLAPSLLCNHCQCHGFIRAGQWVPA